MKKALLAGLGLLAITGCSSVQEVGMAIEGDKAGDPPHFQVLRDHLSGRFFGQNLQTGVMYHCTGTYSSEAMAIIRQHVDNPSWYYGCTKTDKPVIAGQSTMSQLQGPVSAIMLGAGLGAGLAFSGDDTNINQNGGGANATGGAGGVGYGGKASASSSSKSWASSSSKSSVSGIRGHHK